MKNDESIHFSIDILYTCTDNKCKVYIFWISVIKRNRKAKIFWRQLIIYETDQLNSLTEQSSDPPGWVSSKLDWSTALRAAIVSQQAWPHPLSIASDGQAGRSRYRSPLPSTAGQKRLKIHQHQTQLCGTVPFCLYCHTFTRALCNNTHYSSIPHSCSPPFANSPWMLCSPMSHLEWFHTSMTRGESCEENVTDEI